MHDIEPYYQWRDAYTAENDEKSPFYGHEYSEFYFNNAVYNHAIHPQWDEIGSPTLYVKLIYCDYDDGFAIIELLGEWNDCIHNDVMFLKREVADILITEGINKFILIGENVLNFHGEEDDYYGEWYEDLEDGWIVALNFEEHVREEFKKFRLDYYFNFGAELDNFPWRTYNPKRLYQKIDGLLRRRLNG